MPERPVRIIDNSPAMRATREGLASGMHEIIDPPLTEVNELAHSDSVQAYLNAWGHTPLSPGIASIPEAARRDMVGSSNFFLAADPAVRAAVMWNFANDTPWHLIHNHNIPDDKFPVEALLERSATLRSGNLGRFMNAMETFEAPDLSMTANQARQYIPFMALHVAHAAMVLHNDQLLARRKPDTTIDQRGAEVVQTSRQQLMRVATEIQQGRRQHTKSKNPLAQGYTGALNILQDAYALGTSNDFVEEATAVLLPLKFPEARMSALTGRHLMSNAELFKQRMEEHIRELAHFGVILSQTTAESRDLTAFRRTLTDMTDMAIRDPNTYYNQVDDIHTKLRLTYFARNIVDSLASGTLDYADITRLYQQFAVQQPARERAKRPRITVESPGESLKETQYEEVNIRFLTPGTRQAAGEGQPPRDYEIGPTSREYDPARVHALIEQVGLPWGQGQFRLMIGKMRPKKRAKNPDEPIEITAKEGPVPIRNDYYVLLLKDNLADGTIIWHAVADHPQRADKPADTEHAMYVWNAHRGVVNGRPVVTWLTSMENKDTAYAFGAERILHLPGMYERALDHLLELSKLRRHRQMGLAALLAVRQQEQS